MSLHHAMFGQLETAVPLPTIVNSDTEQGSGTPASVTLTFTPSIGNRMFMYVAQQSATDPVVNSITQTNVTWFRLSGTFNTTMGDHACEMWASNVIIAAPSNNPSVSFSASNLHTMVFMEIENLSASDPIGGEANDGASSGATDMVGVSTASDSIIRALTLNGFVQRRDNTPTLAPDNNFTLVDRIGTGGGNTGNEVNSVFQKFNDTLASIATTVLSSQNERWATSCVTLNGNGGPHGRRLASAGGISAIVQRATNIVQNAGGSIVATFPNPLTAGNLLIAFVVRGGIDGANAAASLSQTNANYTLSFNDESVDEMDIWIDQNIGGSVSQTLTVNSGNSGDSLGVIAYEIQGAVTSGSAFQDSTSIFDTGADANMSTANADTNGASFLALACFVSTQGGITFSGPTNGYVLDFQQNSGGGGSHISMCVLAKDEDTGNSPTSTTLVQSSAVAWGSFMLWLDGS